MSTKLIDRMKHSLQQIGQELWNIDRPDDILDRVLKKLSLLHAQAKVQNYYKL